MQARENGAHVGCWSTGHGDPVLLWYASLLGMQIKVGRWPPEGTEKGSLLEVNSTF